MTRTITQFMWAFQEHFRISLETMAESALGMIGAIVAPRAFLVGFAADEDAQFSVCIEPERGPFEQSQLAAVVKDAESRYRLHEDSRIIHSMPSAHEAFHTELFDRCVRDATCAALAATPAGSDLRFYAGPGNVISSYRVYPVVGVLATRWDALPSLSIGRRNRIYVRRSLQEATLGRVVNEAARALESRTPPDFIRRDDESSLVRAAASDFVAGVVIRTGELFAQSCRDALDAVAAQPYEGRAGIGSILFARRQRPDVEVTVAFERSVSMNNTRAFRKVLEMSGPDLRLLSDGQRVYGLGQLRDSYAPDSEECFIATIVGRGSWELGHAGTPLLRVDNGLARLPRDRLTRDKFDDTVSRLFPNAGTDAGKLWEIAQACSAQAHGTMLVVHPSAADEGRRLVPQAITINPTYLSNDALRAITSIDGAILVSPDGMCHAVGVILDGSATGTGDAARGARYNSAVRYLAGAGKGSLVIIVSEDGMIDLLPDLRRRVRRQEVQAAVDRLVAASQAQIDYEVFYRLDRHVESLEFYLDQEQCQQ